MTNPPATTDTADPQYADAPAFGLMRFGAIKRELDLTWPPTSNEISLSVGLFRDLLRFAVEHITFDESYYLRTYPDVADALANGRFRDAHHHYVEFGYFEDRLPFQVEVDAAFYFRAYPDIQDAVSGGAIPSAQEHFERYGYQEGRLPCEDWPLLAG